MRGDAIARLGALALALTLLLTLSPGAAAEEADVRTITVSAIGDCTLGRSHRMDYFQSFDYVYDREGSAYFLADVAPVLQSDDLTVANLEGVLSESARRQKRFFREREGTSEKKKYCHLGRPEYLSVLTGGGVDALSFANNHNIDYGLQGFLDTVAACERYALPAAYYDTVVRVACQGLTVGLLAVDRTYCSDAVAEEYLYTAMADLKRDCDLIVACVHWGENYKTRPGDSQIRFGHLCVELGADLVLGSHAHVLQGVERYKGRYIFYSLGNFCYGGRLDLKDNDTVIAQQSFTFVNGELQLDDAVRLIPCHMSSRESRNDFRPAIQTGKEAQRILKKISRRSERFGLRFDKEGRPVLEPAEDTELPPFPAAEAPPAPQEIPAILYTLLNVDEGEPDTSGLLEREAMNPEIKKP